MDPHLTKFSVSTAWTQGDRKYMEDRIAVNIKRDENNKMEHAIFAIFDGHGGAAAADAASRILPQQINEALLHSDSPTTALRTAFHRTNDLLYSEFDSWPQSHSVPSTSGTTATVVLLLKDRLFVANCGDSSAVLAIRNDVSDDEKWYPVSVTASESHNLTAGEVRRLSDLGGTISFPENRIKQRVDWTTCSSHCWASRTVCEHDVIKKPILNMTRALGDFWSFSRETRRLTISCEPSISSYSIENDSIMAFCVHSDGILKKPSKLAYHLTRNNRKGREIEANASKDKNHRYTLAHNVIKSTEAKNFTNKDNASIIMVTFNEMAEEPTSSEEIVTNGGSFTVIL